MKKTRMEIPFIKTYKNTNEKKTCTKLDRPQSLSFLFCTSRKKTDLARSLGMKNMGELKLHWEN